MKRIYFFLVFIFLLSATRAQSNISTIYYSKTDMPAFVSSNYYAFFDCKLLAEDLADLLQQATGRHFSIQPYDMSAKTGIFLLLDSTQQYRSNENGKLETDGKNYIRIRARYTTGISYAMYSWLQKLGFNFYLPGKNWSLIPSLQSIFDHHIKNTDFNPYFRLRIFSPSGSMFPVKGLDAEGRNIHEWWLWYRRNRMGCDYIRIDGHIGELFNIVHQKEIEADPAILAPVDGKRQYLIGGKLDPTYAKGVTLFSDWITAEYKKELLQWPWFLPPKKYYTVDAGDGLGYCHTPECNRAFKTVSDQVFSIANETARKIKKINPLAGVSSLAYTERSDTPGIKIEPNVHIMVVPTAFQSVATSAGLMQRWAKKTHNISQYDFINIGVWSYDMPFFNLDKYLNQLNFLKQLKVEGMGLETSWSALGSGIQQYFILRYLCSPYSSTDQVLNEFCEMNFGKAAAAIKRLLQEWYFSDTHLNTNFDKPTFYPDELGRFIQYIQQAQNIEGLNDQIKKRINDLKAYTIYLCKYYELFDAPENVAAYSTTTTRKAEKTKELLRYTWQLYNSMIFHNTQLNDMLKKNLSETEQLLWDFNKSSHFTSLNYNSTQMVNEEFAKVSAQYLPKATPDFTVTDAMLESFVKLGADSISISTIDEAAFGNFIYPVGFYCSAPGSLSISCNAGTAASRDALSKLALISVESNDLSFIKTDIITKENSKTTIVYHIPAKGHYKLYLSQFNATPVKYIIYPGSNLFYFHKKSILLNGLKLQDDAEKSGYPNKYLAILIPPADSILFRNYYPNTANTSSFYTAAGKNIPVISAGGYNAIKCPPKKEGSFLFYSNSVYRWPPILINTAPWYFFLRYPAK